MARKSKTLEYLEIVKKNLIPFIFSMLVIALGVYGFGNFFRISQEVQIMMVFFVAVTTWIVSIARGKLS